jgi:hypothetical protein
MDLVLFTFLS